MVYIFFKVFNEWIYGNGVRKKWVLPRLGNIEIHAASQSGWPATRAPDQVPGQSTLYLYSVPTLTLNLNMRSPHDIFQLPFPFPGCLFALV